MATLAASLSMDRLRAYAELGKPRLSALAVFAVVAGCYMARPSTAPAPALDLILGTTLGTFLCALSGNALNMYREHDFDRLMRRTQQRPLPSGRLQPRQVLGFGVALAGLGLLLIAATSNLLATAVCALILLSYVLVYTPMKRLTPLNTLVGAVPGALPPVVGHVAVRGEFTRDALVLFLIVFCWQIPHFLPIAWRYRDDYARGGFRMLPVADPTGARTKTTMLLYTAGLGIASLIPFVSGMAGEVYLGCAVVLDLLFFVPTVMAAITRYESMMRLVFIASIVYLPLLLGVMVLDRWPV